MRSGALAVVAIDSVAALTPKAEIEGEMGDSHVGLQARLMSQALRKLNGTLHQTDTICFFTNQLREKIGVMFGSPETTPGGRALRFYASIRLDIRRIETLKDGVEAIGNRVRVKVVKNKVAPPFKQAEFDIIYGDGISWEGTVLEVGLDRKVVHEVRLVLLLRRRAPRPGTPERRSVPQGASGRRAEHPPGDPGSGVGGAGDLGAAPADRRRHDRGDTGRPRRGGAGRDSGRIEGRAMADRDPLEIAARALRHRDRSRQEIADRLARAGLAEAEQAGALDALERAGYVDDVRFALARAEALAGRNLGDEAIRHDLGGHGIAGEAAEEAIAALPPEAARAHAVADRLGRTAKTAAALARKGFSPDSLESAFGCEIAAPDG